MIGSYNPSLVSLSLVVAILASYTALDLAGRIRASEGSRSRRWLIGGSFAMGLGVWSMHFIGMLAFRLSMPMGYDPSITFFSLLIAVASSAFALWLVASERLRWPRLITGALLMGSGVAAMHYTGMAAMRMSPGIHYDPFLFSLSLLIAIVASGAALWLAFHLRDNTKRSRNLRFGAAGLMGLAITGMHYTGMAAARFTSGASSLSSGSGVSESWLVVFVTAGTLCVLGVALLTSTFDGRLDSHTAKLANIKNELSYIASHDSLTGLPNRAFLQQRLQEIENKSQAGSVSLLFIDLDGFKALNDAFGHNHGDGVIKTVGERITAAVRAHDLVVRLGADEFVVLVEDHEAENVSPLAARLVAVIREPLELAGRTIRLSASVGISCSNDGLDRKSELLTYADLAMYQAKLQGGGQYCYFEPGMHAEAREKLILMQELPSAVEKGELELQYQPKFRATDLALVGVEALLRWRHPSRGLIGPNVFIPIAEGTGLILPIGRWVIDEACRQMAQWRRLGHDHWNVAVNLSALQLLDPQLSENVRSALRKYRLEPRHLILEVTESTAMKNIDASMRILQELHEIGVGISIDDFGTGYSSLMHLKRLPATELKIDRGFVRELTEGSDDGAIVSAIIALGKTLNLSIVAEGVETPEQQEFLTRIGCNSLQGFLLGRPATPEALSATHPHGRPRTPTEPELPALQPSPEPALWAEV